MREIVRAEPARAPGGGFSGGDGGTTFVDGGTRVLLARIKVLG